MCCCYFLCINHKCSIQLSDHAEDDGDEGNQIIQNGLNLLLSLFHFDENHSRRNFLNGTAVDFYKLPKHPDNGRDYAICPILRRFKINDQENDEKPEEQSQNSNIKKFKLYLIRKC